MSRAQALGLLVLVAAVALAGCTGSRRAAPPATPAGAPSGTAPPRPVSQVWSADLPVSWIETAPLGAADASDVQAALGQLGAVPTARGLVITLPEPVLFDFDRASLRPDARTVLARLAKVIAHDPSARVRIEGHTDAVGSPAYNQALSQRRAQAVEAALAGQFGIPAARMTAQGFGETRPVAPNRRADGSDDPAGRQRNRRVEVVIALP
jgi:outer membrane protein OmpA-like peptidoglycan-associated protein